MLDSRLTLAMLLHSVCSIIAFAASPSDEQTGGVGGQATRVEQSAAWHMESLERSDGKTFHGLLLSADNDAIEFAEVRRPPGKTWYLVIHEYAPKSVVSLARISKSDREQLLTKIKPLLENKSHARIEAGQAADVVLTETRRDDATLLRYDGELFTLESTADDETTRRCVVRIEQVFRAYRHVLPPRTQRDDKLRVLLEGSLDAYRSELRRRQLSVDNPAVYYTQHNLILAGSELTRFAQRVAQIKQQNEQLREQYESLDKNFPDRLKQLAAELKDAGFSGNEIEAEVRARSAAWKRELSAAFDKIAEVNRRNDAKFSEVTDQMFRRLYHESFHAYLENYVFPHEQSSVPRWLNEGLAQVFEGGQLEAETLRIDQPSRELLKQLKADLASGQPLPLGDLLKSQERSFLVTHDTNNASARHYLYAWGLAHYLTFEQDLLAADTLEKYVSKESANLPPIERFERLIAMPLAEFETHWRKTFLEMPLPSR